MRPAFDVALQILDLIFPLLELRDPSLYAHIEASGVDPQFAISWHLTWLSHDIDSLPKAARLFDFFLSSPPLMTVYFAVEVMCHLKAGLMEAEADYCEIYTVLKPPNPAKFDQDLPLDAIIASTSSLFLKYPPASLAQFAKVNFANDLMVLRSPPYWESKGPLDREEIIRRVTAWFTTAGKGAARGLLTKHAMAALFSLLSLLFLGFVAILILVGATWHPENTYHYAALPGAARVLN